ncbi:hypothetical protein [Rhodococcus sp. WY5]|jgi:hypothetical protein|uniref:hypothetical protein n=1 Tax=Rhodococcus sp. WY5 TaxID=2708349 RepID=UPI001BDE5CC3|nr:hypothetical protein [Rhodococcus sp. WY5]
MADSTVNEIAISGTTLNSKLHTADEATTLCGLGPAPTPPRSDPVIECNADERICEYIHPEGTWTVNRKLVFQGPSQCEPPQQ